ncbi:uncharacterized protein N7479_007969 [Penicillium vulpinum]|uniref:uncharacterized protein n=1 Tax=Penicillium vulpinum TaxID=29845 RepID=UPI002547C892|nr:uncharacterized protein N7479_007969 [Penicillium vulpinum]KAJ5960819.1 hypothetical protein N7479_007969 [Penicillium vulpinum]
MDHRKWTRPPGLERHGASLTLPLQPIGDIRSPPQLTVSGTGGLLLDGQIDIQFPWLNLG